MKVVLAGGTGHVGQALIRRWLYRHDLTILSRQFRPGVRTVEWDGATLGEWAKELDGADVVVNMAGRSVNCRYNADNLAVMLASRVDSTKAIGEAIAMAKNPPKVWLQASTATIYAHRFDAANDEITGIIGGDEPGQPSKWKASIDIAKAWEKALFDAHTPTTRKVALRSAMTMSPIPKSVFGVMADLARRGIGGKQGDGRQYVSWIHELDFARALEFLLESDLEGPVNIASPNPLPQAEFARGLREAVGAKFAPTIPKWALEIGAFFMHTETELILKSRRVVPTRLIESGFEFKFPTWPEAARDLVAHQPPLAE